VSKYVGGIGQGAASTRFTVFDRKGQIVSVARKRREQIHPEPGSVERNANEVGDSAERATAQALRIAGKGDSEWSYSRVPALGPLVGAAIAAARITASISTRRNSDPNQ
jgi:glycerol kinase